MRIAEKFQLNDDFKMLAKRLPELFLAGIAFEDVMHQLQRHLPDEELADVDAVFNTLCRAQDEAIKMLKEQPAQDGGVSPQPSKAKKRRMQYQKIGIKLATAAASTSCL
jgi:hypothetical protein